MTLAPVLLLLASGPGHAACPASTAALSADLATAETAHLAWAWEEFDAAVAAVRLDLGCLAEPIATPEVATVHRLFALAGARARDEAGAVAAFRGLLAVDPAWAPDLELAPQGSLLRQAWEQARGSLGDRVRPLPAGAWIVDGEAGATVLPTARAALVQLDDGTLHSWYLDGRDLPPDLEERLRPPPIVRTTEPRPGHPSRALLASGLAVAAVGAGGLLAGEALQAEMMDTARRARAETLFHAGVAASIGGLGLGVAGCGLVVGAMVVGRW
jgi:hypothetical protein